jgi:hypothetical protein
MKKILLILLLASCQTTVQTELSDNFTHLQSGFINAGLVVGFEHVYDSCHFSATNTATNKQFFQDSRTPNMVIGLSEGPYNFVLYTPDPDSIQSYLAFFAIAEKTIIKGSNTVTLTATSKQSLILVDKSSVNGSPAVKVGTNIGVMSMYGNYYYAYVLGPFQLGYKVGTESFTLSVNAVKEKIYLFTASSLGTSINDPFKEVIKI